MEEAAAVAAALAAQVEAQEARDGRAELEQRASSAEAAQREAASEVAEELGAPFLILDCHAPEAVIAGWLEQRQSEGTDPSDATLDVIKAQQASREALSSEELSHSKRVDTHDSALAAVLGLDDERRRAASSQETRARVDEPGAREPANKALALPEPLDPARKGDVVVRYRVCCLACVQPAAQPAAQLAFEWKWGGVF